MTANVSKYPSSTIHQPLDGLTNIMTLRVAKHQWKLATDVRKVKLHKRFPPIYQSPYVINVLFYFVVLPTIFHTTSIWLTVGLALQRYVYICHPVSARRFCTEINVIKGKKCLSNGCLNVELK